MVRPSWREFGGLAAAALAIVSLFLPWTALSSGNPAVQSALAELPAGDVTRSVWRATFFGWFPPLLVVALGVTVAIVGRVHAARVGGLPQLWLIGACLALLCTVLGWLLADWQFGSEERAVLEAGGVAVEAGMGRYVGALATVGSVAFAALDTRALHGEARGQAAR